uniref:Uncharacterized protein n=1 Tax=Zea mays TaxID=4577 RepID=A0A804NP71_MAIZE
MQRGYLSGALVSSVQVPVGPSFSVKEKSSPPCSLISTSDMVATFGVRIRWPGLDPLPTWKVSGVVHKPTANSVASIAVASTMEDLEAIIGGEVFVRVRLFI